MNTRLLSQSEFHATFADRMIDIKGREDEMQPEGVIDLEPYLDVIPDDDLGGMRLRSGVPPAAVYRAGDGRFDHVLYPCNRSNVYVVIVIQLRPERIFGHFILDLAEEYGLDAPTA
jgi:hypothetical protein